MDAKMNYRELMETRDKLKDDLQDMIDCAMEHSEGSKRFFLFFLLGELQGAFDVKIPKPDDFGSD